MRQLGHLQRDILDSLQSSGPLSVRDLSVDMGRHVRHVHFAMSRMRAHGLVVVIGVVPWPAGRPPALHRITARGRAELQRRVSRGIAPGVPLDGPHPGLERR